MTNLAGVRAAVLKFIESTPSNRSFVVVLHAHELAILHLTLELFQEMIERTGLDASALEGLGVARKAVEDVLRQAGYGKR